MKCFLGVLLSVLALHAANGQLNVHVYDFYTSANSILADNTIREITEAPDSSLWIGTDWGIAIVKDSGWELLQTTNSNIPGDDIQAIAFDDIGQPWIATGQHGIGYLADTGWVTYNMANSPLPNNDVKAIAFDNTGQAWIGTIAGISCICDTGWAHYDINNTPLTVNNIASIAVDDTNTIWFGTLNGGLARFDGTNWQTYTLWNSQIPDNTIHDIVIRDNGIIWLATPAGGLALFNGSIFQTFSTLNSDIGTNSLFGLDFDSTGTAFLVSNNRGMIAYMGSNDWQAYNTNIQPDSNSNFLPEDDLLSIAIGYDETIWIGTRSSGLVSMKRFTVDTLTSIALAQSVVAGAIVFPNPFNDHIQITVNSNAQLSMADIQGNIVYQAPILAGTQKEIPLGDLPKGIYFMLIRSTSGNTAVHRLVKQ